ncbi:hypothetical protein EV175_004996 [Coemansia sp. RSA 1933]|nr:hypothetical protein EV175_004996 [Coemansia sp. RSA 1933]
MEDKGEENGNRRFSLFSALNGLFERARSSAEKEAHRLFTSPLPSNAGQQAANSVGQPGDARYGSPVKRQRGNSTRPVLAESVARTKTRPRPARTASDVRAASAAAIQRPVQQAPPQRPASVVSDRSRLANTVDLMTIAARRDSSDDDRRSEVEPSVLSTPGSHLKRKLSDVDAVEHSILSTPGSRLKRKLSAVNSVASSSSASKISSHVSSSPESGMASTAASTALDGALVHASALLSASGESTATVHSAAEVLTVGKQQQAPAPETERRKAVVGFEDDARKAVVGLEDDKRKAVVERSRLEKVERELRQLKRIIASLVPGELNDDDLRSVYGELDIGRQSSEDVLSRLMRIRAGAAPSRADAPPLPQNFPSTISRPAQALAATTPRAAVPPPPPPPLPSPPFSALARDSKAAASAAAAARAQLSLPPAPHKGTTPIGSPEAPTTEQPPRPSTASVQRLRSDLRPISAPKQPAPKPPPHKDPNVMSQMLNEMKTHKLRPVKKPKDMEAAIKPKRQRK